MGESGKAYKDVEGKQAVQFVLHYVGTKEDIEEAVKKADKLDIVKLSE